jgi:hypothetical protein
MVDTRDQDAAAGEFMNSTSGNSGTTNKTSLCLDLTRGRHDLCCEWLLFGPHPTAPLNVGCQKVCHTVHVGAAWGTLVARPKGLGARQAAQEHAGGKTSLGVLRGVHPHLAKVRVCGGGGGRASALNPVLPQCSEEPYPLDVKLANNSRADGPSYPWPVLGPQPIQCASSIYTLLQSSN